MNIEKLTQQPESKTLEFKQDLSSLTPILKTIVAFANTAGGILIVGRSPDGTILGVDDLFSAEERLANAIADNIRPGVLPEIEITTIDGKNLLVIQVAHWKGPFYLKKQGIPGGVYVRLGSTSRPISPEMLAELKRSIAYTSFDQEPIPELSSDAIKLSRVKRVFRQVNKSIDRKKMRSLGLLTEFSNRVVPTVAVLHKSRPEAA